MLEKTLFPGSKEPTSFPGNFHSDHNTEKRMKNSKITRESPGWSRLISNKEWFADFYGKDLETGQVIAGKRNTTYYGKDGVTSYLNDERTLIEKAHETLLMYPVEEEQFEKVDWKVIIIFA